MDFVSRTIYHFSDFEIKGGGGNGVGRMYKIEKKSDNNDVKKSI